MNKSLRWCLGVAAVVSIPCLQSVARADELQLELGGFVGWHMFSDKNTLGRSVDNDQQGFNDFLIFGPRLSAGSRTLMVDAELGLIPSKTHDGASNLWIDTERFNLRVNFLDGPIRPFVLGGVGMIHVLSSSNTAVVAKNTEGLATLGAGVLYEAQSWGARLDVRTMAGSGVATHNWAFDWEILLGAYARFTCGGGAGPTVATSDDADRDGILDANDRCPAQPETRNGYEDSDGCPDDIPEAVRRFTGKMKDIEFDTGQATLRPGSSAILDKTAQVMRDYPNIRLLIEGHTDNVGTREFNQDLSQKRAEAVRAYLIGKGVAGDRLTAQGFGQDRPEADNSTEAGRADNRRVEFKLVQ